MRYSKRELYSFSKNLQKNDYVFLLRNCTKSKRAPGFILGYQDQFFKKVLNTFKGHHHPQDTCFSTPLWSQVSGMKNECFMEVFKNPLKIFYVFLLRKSAMFFFSEIALCFWVTTTIFEKRF